MLAWLLTAALAAEADPAALKADLAKWEAALDAQGKYDFDWTDKEMAALARGEVVKRREKHDGADRVIGAVWTPAPLPELWTAVQDEWHWGHVDGLIDERLPSSTFQDKILYQRIEAPWPFKDRQWVIRIVNNLELWESTGEQVIERTWDLSDQRGAKAEVKDGVWVPVNDGGWFAASAAGGTVVAYHVRATIGGNIPDDAASTWTMMTLGGMMRGLVEASKASKGHYVGDHPTIQWPDEEPIPKF